MLYNSLLRPVSTDEDGNRIGLPGQSEINENESRNIRGRILERDDETEEVVEKCCLEQFEDGMVFRGGNTITAPSRLVQDELADPFWIYPRLVGVGIRIQDDRDTSPRRPNFIFR